MAVSKTAFWNRIISIHSGNDIQWPPRSPDLSICDFFVWGYLKSKVYQNKLRSLRQLKKIFEKKLRRSVRAYITECSKILKNVLKNVSVAMALIYQRFYSNKKLPSVYFLIFFTRSESVVYFHQYEFLKCGSCFCQTLYFGVSGGLPYNVIT